MRIWQTLKATNTASLDDMKQAIHEQAQELLAKQKEKVESSLKQSKQLSQTKTAIKTNEKNRFADICGILTSEKSASLEDMERAIALQGVERFNDCV